MHPRGSACAACWRQASCSGWSARPTSRSGSSGSSPRTFESTVRRALASVLTDIAAILAGAGDFDEARRVVGEALALRQKIGAPGGISHALGYLGVVELRAGEFTRARELSEEAITFAEDPYLPTLVAALSLTAGAAARRSGDLAGAVPLLLRALRLLEDLGQRAAFPELLQEVAAADIRRPAVAARLLGASERLVSETGMPRDDPADYEETLATLRAALGDAAFEEAWTAGAELSDDEALSLAARCLD